MLACCCASPDCPGQWAQVRRIGGPTITAPQGAVPTVPTFSGVRPKLIEFHPDGSVKRVEYR